MIDITPYQQRLEWLKEWIADRLDGRISPPIWVNLDAVNFNYTIEDVMRIYEQIGILITRKEVIEHPALPFSFEEYCKYKHSLTLK